MAVLDIMDRPIQPRDFVVFYNRIYQVKAIPVTTTDCYRQVRIVLIDPSKTTKPVSKYSREMCLLDGDEVLLWMLKKGYQQ